LASGSHNLLAADKTDSGDFMTELTRTVLDGLRDRGYVSRIVPVGRAQDLETEIRDRCRKDLVDRELCRLWLDKFVFEPQGLADARTLIVTAYPQPRFRVTFRVDGRANSYVIPPTYITHGDKLATDVLIDILGQHGYSAVGATLPAKLLAVRSGLAKYGRNNISYIDEMGSFYRLRAFFSNMPVADDHWQEPRMLEECVKCTACIQSCPTGAIPSDRFLLRAERCLPFFNERDTELPEWIDPSSHNSLIGCMICQNVCPVDRPFRDWAEDVAEFDERETELILEEAPLQEHDRETQRKLKAIEFSEDLAVLARNLRLLLALPRAEPLNR
jgi:epoxyqueuosine reductase